jgi:cell division protein FtsN
MAVLRSVLGSVQPSGGGGFEKPMADIFISYAREDETRIKELVTAFEGHGWSVFWDRRIPAGDTWRSYIGAALEEARCILVAWSQHSTSSEWVAEEADEGKRRGILVPLLLDPVQPPRGFREIQAADITGWQPGEPSQLLDQLFADITRCLQRMPRPQHKVPNTDNNNQPPTEDETTLLESLRKAMLLSRSASELRQYLYQLEAYLANNPHSPEARLLKDNIQAAMRRAEAMEGPPAKAAMRARPQLTWLIALALIALTAPGAYFYYKATRPSAEKPIIVEQQRPTPDANSVQPVARNRWLVIAGSFARTDSRGAEQRRLTLARAGYEAITVDTSDYPLLRPDLWAVVVGPFESQAQADAMLAKVKDVVPDAYVKQGR